MSWRQGGTVLKTKREERGEKKAKANWPRQAETDFPRRATFVPGDGTLFGGGGGVEKRCGCLRTNSGIGQMLAPSVIRLVPYGNITAQCQDSG